jgi:hypothetical protein
VCIVTFVELEKLATFDIKATRRKWDEGEFVVIAAGLAASRISFGFQGPYKISEEDKAASDRQLYP